MNGGAVSASIKSSLTYRPELDGLRAVAVLLVVGYHAGFSIVRGGYVGVDVFFVISGYLITRVALDDCARGSFSLPAFWERRARRVLPALFLLLLCVLVPAVLLPPVQLKSFGASLVAAAAFSANFYFLRDTGGYFAPSTSLVPLLHIWSLGVEEQFYILYPLALVPLWRKTRARLPWVVGGGLLLSLGASELLSRVHPEAAFFLLPTRAWELLAGGLAAFAPGAAFRLVCSRAQGPLAAAGLIMILAAAHLFDGSTRIPGLPAVLPVLGALLVIGCARSSTAVGRLLSSKPFVQLGLISYGVYLWHLPLLVFARFASLNALGGVTLGLLLIVAVAVAWASERFVEAPFRRRGVLSRRQFAITTLATAFFLAAVGLMIWVEAGFPHRLSPSLQRAATLKEDTGRALAPCMARNGVLPAHPCMLGEGGPITVAILGDSHASALYLGLTPYLSRRQQRAILLTQPGCRPGPGSATRNCGPFYRNAFDFVTGRPNIRMVIFAARWTKGLVGTTFDNGEGGVEEPRGTREFGRARQHAIAEANRAAVEALLRTGKKVVLVYPVPEAGWDVPIYMVKERLLHRQDRRPLSTSYAHFVARNRPAYAMLDAIPAHANLARLYPARELCDRLLPKRCLLKLGDEPLYFDDNHLSAAGARLALRGLDALSAPPSLADSHSRNRR